MSSYGWPELLQLLALAAVLGLVPAMIGYRKGRKLLVWWLFGTLLFIIALPAPLIFSKDAGGGLKPVKLGKM
jgi:hypothetical protein